MEKHAPQGAWRGHRIFAATYDRMSRGAEHGELGRLRARVVGSASGRVLEIGAGTGANFPHYRLATSVIATEPDPHMLRRARRRGATVDRQITLYRCAAEALPFPDESFDTVVCTLVLCTVASPALSLQEIRRLLVPGGSLRFIEHVRKDGYWLGQFQDMIDPLWRRCAAGCRPNRRTAPAIEAAGLEIVELQTGRLSPLLPLISGMARRTS